MLCWKYASDHLMCLLCAYVHTRTLTLKVLFCIVMLFRNYSTIKIVVLSVHRHGYRYSLNSVEANRRPAHIRCVYVCVCVRAHVHVYVLRVCVCVCVYKFPGPTHAYPSA